MLVGHLNECCGVSGKDGDELDSLIISLVLLCNSESCVESTVYF